MARPKRADTSSKTRSEPEAQASSEPKRVPHPELGAKLKAIVAERQKAEAKYEKQQAVMREMDQSGRRQTPEYQAELDKLNVIRAEIGRIGEEHHNMSVAFSYASGGVVHRSPTPTP